ncbi:MAG: ECF-type sigma factor [Planctomycetota bacterium]
MDPLQNSETNELLPLVYGELRALAQSFLLQERPDHTLRATALVHEAYLRLRAQDRTQWQNRSHFVAVAAQMIRRILVDHARKRSSQRAGGRWQRISLHGDCLAQSASEIDLLELEDALSRLAALNERHARIVELRFYGGLTVPEVATVLGLGTRVIERDWTLARAWLQVELGGGACA